MSEKRIEIVREYNFDPKEVIAGLNGYYESDKRNGYITVGRRSDLEGPAYLAAALYLSALIEWLREDHDIFYRPGMTLKIEAARNAAKMCCLRAHIKDEICKRGLWCDKDADIPALVDTLFKAYDCCDERANANRKEVKDIMNNIRQESSRNGFELPEEIDGEPLTIERTFHDLLELLMKRTKEIREVNDKRWKDLRDINKALGCDGMDGHVDDFAKAVKARAECNNRALGEESDINKLIRDYCTEHGIVAPSRYFSDKACIEYLFSVIDLERKHRTAVGKQMVDDYEKDIMDHIRKEASRNGFELPEEIDGETLNAKRVFHDLFENMQQLRNTKFYTCCAFRDILEALGVSRSHTIHLSINELKSKAIQRANTIKSEHDRYQKQLGKATADYQALNEENQKNKSVVFDIESVHKETLIHTALEKKIIDSAAAEELRNLIFYDVVEFICQECYDRTEYCLKKMSELDGYKKHFETLKEKQEFLSKQNMELSCKLCAKDDEISRLKGLINAMNEEVKDM